MASQGPLSPSSSINLGSGTAWSDPTYVYASDALYASVNLAASGGQSRKLRITNFGFSVPEDAVIDGLLAEFQMYGNGLGIDLRDVSLVNNDTPIGVAKIAVNSYLSESYIASGDESDLWDAALTPAIVNSATFGIQFHALNVHSTEARRLYLNHVRITVFYTPTNTAPSIAVAPTVSYGSLTRLGPNNSPAIVSFTATDADGDPLTYQIRTAASGGGTLVASGNANLGSTTNVNIAYNATGLVEGTNALYLRVHDGTAYSADSSFDLLRDTEAPSVGTITVDPPIVTGGSG